MGTNVNPETRNELITKKAQELFVKRGKVPGRELDDWLEAERLVDQELQAKSREPQARSEPAARPTPASTPGRSTTSSKLGKVKGFS